MKIFVVNPAGEETLLSFKHKDVTLGEILEEKSDTIIAAEINHNFDENWKEHKLKKDDRIRLFCKTNGGYGELITLLIVSVLSTVLSIVLAPKPKKPSVNKNQPSIGISGIQNTIAPGTPKFITYGRRRVFGHLIASKVDVIDPTDGPDTGKKMSYSALYYMGVGPIHDICDIQINNTHIEDIEGPPEFNVRLGTEDQTVITNHELVHQTYGDGRELEIQLREGKSKSFFPDYGTPIIYTTNSNIVNRATLFINFPLGIFQYGVHGRRYGSAITAKVEYKLNSLPQGTWTENSFVIESSSEAGLFWKNVIEFPFAGKWDIRISLLPSGRGSFGNGPSANLFNVMETSFITTSYPGNALLEVNGIANDQIRSFDDMACSAIVCGRLVDVYKNGIYVKEFSRNRVWIVRDLLFDSKVALGNRLSPDLWNNAAGLDAANYYEELTLNFDGDMEQRDYCDVIINEVRSGSDHIKTLLFEGRAIMFMSSGKYTYVLDKDKPLIPGNYIKYSFPGNIIKDSLQFEKGSADKPINTIRAEFPNEENNFKVIPAKLVYPGTEDEPERQEQVSFTSIIRRSQASREMNFRLKKLRLIKRKWAWKSPKSAIISEPYDISKLSYNVSKNLRGYNGLLNNNRSTDSRIETGKEIYLAPGFTYSAHIVHNNVVEEQFITNPTGLTYSIINLSSPLSFTPVQGDLWTVGKSIGSTLEVQIDDIEADGEDFLLKCHEHIPEIYIDTLTDVTAGENTNTGGVIPQPLLGAQVGLTGSLYQANVVTGYNSLIGTYSSITSTSVVLALTEPNIDGFFNNAYIKLNNGSYLLINDYIGSSRSVIVTDTGLTAGTISGEYEIIWNGFSSTNGFNISYGPTIAGSWTSLANVTGTSYGFIAAALTASSANYFRLAPIDINENINLTGAWVVAPGVSDVVPPVPPFAVNIATNSGKQAIVSVILNTPVSRDTYKLETNLTLNSITGSGLTATFFDISNIRNDANTEGNSRTTIYDLSDYNNGNLFYARAAILDFYGNKSDYAVSFTGATLSAAEIDAPVELLLDDTIDTVVYTGITTTSIFNFVVEGGVMSSINSIELDIELLVTPGSTISTILDFEFTFGGNSIGTLSCSLADGITAIDVDTPYWLNLLLNPDGTATDQNGIIQKWGEEAPSNTLRTDSGSISTNSDIDQVLEVTMTLTGDSNTIVKKQRQLLNQLLPN